MRLQPTCLAALLLSLVLIGRLPGPARAQARAAAPDIFAAYPEAVVTVDANDGTFVSFRGARITGFEGTPEEVAVQFLRKVLTSNGGLPIDPQILDRRESDAGGIRYLISMNNPMHPGGYLVGVDRPKQGRRFYADESGHVAAPGYVFVHSPGKPDFDAWRSDWYVYFAISTDLPEANELAALDAQSGTFAGAESAAVAGTPGIAFSRAADPLSCPTGDFSLEGTGNVYPTNPLHGEPESRPLPGLCNQSPAHLIGRHVQVEVYPGKGVAPSSQDGSFDFGPESQGFDDVSVYYHVDRFLEMMAELQFPSGVTGVSITTRSSETPTAIAVYKSARLIFGVPSPPYRDAAREAALIAHETTHLLMYKLPQGQSFFGNGLKEWWAMGEAYPDYFGLYYRSRQFGHDSTWVHPVFSEYVAMETSPDLPRDVSSPGPNYSGYGHVNYVGLEEGGSINEYDNSVIFSSALLDFDRSDDSENSVSFIIESLSNLPVTPTFRSGRDGLMIAASACAISQQPDTYECCERQACDADVAGAFASRGIGEPEEGIVLAREPEARPPLPSTPILDVHPAYPNPFSVDSHVRYELTRAESVRIRVYDAGGRLVDRILDRPMSTGSHTFTWSPRNQPPGAYFFEITAGTHVKRGSMILVK